MQSEQTGTLAREESIVCHLVPLGVCTCSEDDAGAAWGSKMACWEDRDLDVLGQLTQSHVNCSTWMHMYAGIRKHRGKQGREEQSLGVEPGRTAYHSITSVLSSPWASAMPQSFQVLLELDYDKLNLIRGLFLDLGHVNEMLDLLARLLECGWRSEALLPKGNLGQQVAPWNVEYWASLSSSSI